MAQSIKVLGVALAVLVATAAAQARPDFSGRWTAVPEPPPAGGGRSGPIAPGTVGSGWGPDITIRQDASMLAVDRAQFSQYDMQPAMRFTYALDGSESRNTINMGRGPQQFVSTAAWQDAALVISTSYPFTNPQNGKPDAVEVRQVLSRELPDGRADDRPQLSAVRRLSTYPGSLASARSPRPVSKPGARFRLCLRPRACHLTATCNGRSAPFVTVIEAVGAGARRYRMIRRFVGAVGRAPLPVNGSAPSW
jgi:hypothetical protein